MRKKDLGGRLVKKAIIWGMTAMLAFSTPMVVLAEEGSTEESHSESGAKQAHDAKSEGREASGEAGKAKSESNSASKDAGKAESAASDASGHASDTKSDAQDAKEDSHDAKVEAKEAENPFADVKDAGDSYAEAVADAKEAVGDANDAIKDADSAIKDAEKAANLAGKAAGEAVKAAEDAKEAKADAVETAKDARDAMAKIAEEVADDAADLKDLVGAYKDAHEANKTAVTGATEKNAVTDENDEIIGYEINVEVEKVDEETGETVTENVEACEYAAGQAEDAQTAATLADNLLQEAIESDSKEAAKEVLEGMQAAVDAAKTAKENAEKAYDAVKDEKDAAVQQYNDIAAKYGLPAYGTEGWASYFSALYSSKEMYWKAAEINKEHDDLVSLKNYKHAIESANTAMDSAWGAYNTANQALAEARAAAAKAQKVAGTAEKATDDAQKYAQDAIDAANEAVSAVQGRLPGGYGLGDPGEIGAEQILGGRVAYEIEHKVNLEYVADGVDAVKAAALARTKADKDTQIYTVDGKQYVKVDGTYYKLPDDFEVPTTLADASKNETMKEGEKISYAWSVNEEGKLICTASGTVVSPSKDAEPITETARGERTWTTSAEENALTAAWTKVVWQLGVPYVNVVDHYQGKEVIFDGKNYYVVTEETKQNMKTVEGHWEGYGWNSHYVPEHQEPDGSYSATVSLQKLKLEQHWAPFVGVYVSYSIAKTTEEVPTDKPVDSNGIALNEHIPASDVTIEHMGQGVIPYYTGDLTPFAKGNINFAKNAVNVVDGIIRAASGAGAEIDAAENGKYIPTFFGPIMVETGLKQEEGKIYNTRNMVMFDWFGNYNVNFNKTQKEIASLLADLGAKIDTLTEQLESIGGNIRLADEALKSAKNAQKWGNILVADNNAAAFAQMSDEDEDGLRQYLFANEREFDLTDEDVKSRGEAAFSERLGQVEIPFELMRHYVDVMKNHNADWYKWNHKGEGSALGDEEIFWVTTTDEDGNIVLTGDYYKAGEAKPDGTYFRAYVLKNENDGWKYDFNGEAGDGFHLDGYLVDFKNPVTRRRSSGNRTTAVAGVTIEDLATPLAATIEDEMTPLAFSIEDELTPLANSPQTGDNSVPVAPVAAAGVFALAASFFLGRKKKED